MSASSGIRVASGSMARPPRPGNWRGKTSMAGAIAFCQGRKTMALPPAWEKQTSLKGAAVSAPLKGNHGSLIFLIIVIRLAISTQHSAFSHEAVWRGEFFDPQSIIMRNTRAALVWMQWLLQRFADFFAACGVLKAKAHHGATAWRSHNQKSDSPRRTRNSRRKQTCSQGKHLKIEPQR